MGLGMGLGHVHVHVCVCVCVCVCVSCVEYSIADREGIHNLTHTHAHKTTPNREGALDFRMTFNATFIAKIGICQSNFFLNFT
jgi:hypothetical protein